ncbi:uncharacterized protein K460DRAFT_401082 [Cucurbitaria berberidis CBS 394.84]|uniref:Protein-ribulosamine 3-kinase n=1 Tax=Cucurbitaria berberidis CBS 394.84 TaxID=1168544 RepID=A0A9P4GSR2_9PLEO|nr:uncharacterized protein K460DRAFT_401082 [Cucurbitaria berberidis CBS 394.84]KAF1851055.1 hypothetical protein K460DRAFT_401082 [Cucurbitaria berberidis CBS 394.84]
MVKTAAEPKTTIIASATPERRWAEVGVGKDALDVVEVPFVGTDVAFESHGMIMLKGEYESSKIIYGLPKPIGFGRYKIENPPTYFYLSEFVDMDVTTAPDPSEFTERLAQLHQVMSTNHCHVAPGSFIKDTAYSLNPNAVKLGIWRCQFSSVFRSKEYTRHYLRNYPAEEPVAEFNDRNRVYSLKNDPNYSVGHPGTSLRKSAYNNMCYLCEKYAPVEGIDKYDPRIDPSVTGAYITPHLAGNLV